MNFNDAYNLVVNTAQYNNAWNAQQAERQMEFQREMSNTAHQREVADLQAAGLNPVLSAKLGGASTPTGASAQADTSLTSAVLQLAQQAMEANTMSAAALYNGSSGNSNNLSAPGIGSAKEAAGVNNLSSVEKNMYEASLAGTNNTIDFLKTVGKNAPYSVKPIINGAAFVLDKTKDLIAKRAATDPVNSGSGYAMYRNYVKSKDNSAKGVEVKTVLNNIRNRIKAGQDFG